MTQHDVIDAARGCCKPILRYPKPFYGRFQATDADLDTTFCQSGGVPLCCLSSHEDGFWWVVEGAVSEHGVEDAESAVGESDDGLVVAFALAAFAVVVGAAFRVGADDREGRQEECAFEPLVPAVAYPFGLD